jgi:hypothetical protein
VVVVVVADSLFDQIARANFEAPKDGVARLNRIRHSRELRVPTLRLR